MALILAGELLGSIPGSERLLGLSEGALDALQQQLAAEDGAGEVRMGDGQSPPAAPPEETVIVI